VRRGRALLGDVFFAFCSVNTSADQSIHIVEEQKTAAWVQRDLQRVKNGTSISPFLWSICEADEVKAVQGNIIF
jgi:hypothetical protein